MIEWEDESEEGYSGSEYESERIVLYEQIHLLFQKLKEQEIEINKLKNGKSN